MSNSLSRGLCRGGYHPPAKIPTDLLQHFVGANSVRPTVALYVSCGRTLCAPTVLSSEFLVLSSVHNDIIVNIDNSFH